MTISPIYEKTETGREEIDALQGAVILEFGAPWCHYCRDAQPHIAAAMARFAAVRHLRIEDGPGRRLGRSFRVKLWPTLIFLRDGDEKARLVRPTEAAPIERSLQQIAEGSE